MASGLCDSWAVWHLHCRFLVSNTVPLFLLYLSLEYPFSTEETAHGIMVVEHFRIWIKPQPRTPSAFSFGVDPMQILRVRFRLLTSSLGAKQNGSHIHMQDLPSLWTLERQEKLASCKMVTGLASRFFTKLQFGRAIDVVSFFCDRCGLCKISDRTVRINHTEISHKISVSASDIGTSSHIYAWMSPCLTT
jgi:hypothetical protein